MATAPAPTGHTASKTVTDTIVGEHTHTIVGYSLIKGIGDGEPIASERFSVGGHEWVLLFYPDGKRSSSGEGHLGDGGPPPAVPMAAPLLLMNAPPLVPVGQDDGAAAAAAGPQAAGGPPAAAAAGAPPHHGAQAQAPPAAPMHAGAAAAAAAAAPPMHHHQAANMAGGLVRQVARRDTTNEYAALFVALIGEGPLPQGIVSTSEGKVVRAFHRFTLVDQSGATPSRDLTKGRTRDAGAVKISCARQDPNARNCHGYRKFVKRSILEDPQRGFLANDTLVIKYTIELVVSSGGALSRNANALPPSRTELVSVPSPCLGPDLLELLASGNGADCTFVVENEEMQVHKIILEARSSVFRALLNSSMREGQEGRVVIENIRSAVFRTLLHFVYSDSLPEEHDGSQLEVAMAQHLLVAADQYQLVRLRRICERRLCETVDVETVATTLTLSEQNHAEELKKVCLGFVSRHLQAVMATDGYRHMTRSCPSLQAEILSTIAAGNNNGGNEREARGDHRGHGNHARGGGGNVRVRELASNGPAIATINVAGDGSGDDIRRVRQRRE